MSKWVKEGVLKDWKMLAEDEKARVEKEIRLRWTRWFFDNPSVDLQGYWPNGIWVPPAPYFIQIGIVSPFFRTLELLACYRTFTEAPWTEIWSFTLGLVRSQRVRGFRWEPLSVYLTRNLSIGVRRWISQSFMGKWRNWWGMMDSMHWQLSPLCHFIRMSTSISSPMCLEPSGFQGSVILSGWWFCSVRSSAILLIRTLDKGSSENPLKGGLNEPSPALPAQWSGFHTWWFYYLIRHHQQYWVFCPHQDSNLASSVIPPAPDPTLSTISATSPWLVMTSLFGTSRPGLAHTLLWVSHCLTTFNCLEVSRFDCNFQVHEGIDRMCRVGGWGAKQYPGVVRLSGCDAK